MIAYARAGTGKRMNQVLTFRTLNVGCGRRPWCTKAEGGRARGVTTVRWMIRMETTAATAWGSPGSGAAPGDQMRRLDWIMIIVPKPGNSCMRSQMAISMYFVLIRDVLRYGYTSPNCMQKKFTICLYM